MLIMFTGKLSLEFICLLIRLTLISIFNLYFQHCLSKIDKIKHKYFYLFIN
jgi:hypothetical protein